MEKNLVKKRKLVAINKIGMGIELYIETPNCLMFEFDATYSTSLCKT
jgi:hypothetical protein